jgi:MFS family permease
MDVSQTAQTRISVADDLQSIRSRSLYRSYLLILLSVVFAFNGVDRAALALLLQNIKLSLHLTDVQLGLLTGIAFSLFYSVMGVPLGFLADRRNRIVLVSVTAALWGMMVGLCAAATTFLQLLLIRIGVAVGESGCVPPSHSLIADHFARAERARATAIYYTIALFLSSLVGHLLTGWLNQLYGWRVTFVILGVPGVFLGAVVLVSLRESRTSRPSQLAEGLGKSADADSPPTTIEALRFLWTNRTFRSLLLAFSLIYFFAYGIAQWQPTFFIRSYGLHTGALGTWFTLTSGLGATFGTYFGGDLASRFARNDEKLQLAAAGFLYAGIGILSAFIYLSSSYRVSFALIAIATIGGALTFAPLFATIQTLIPPRMRAVSVALLYFAGNLIGAGLGPLAVGALSQALQTPFGSESLRYALVAMCPGYLLSGWYFWRASRTVAQDIAAFGSSPSSIRP